MRAGQELVLGTHTCWGQHWSSVAGVLWTTSPGLQEREGQEVVMHETVVLVQEQEVHGFLLQVSPSLLEVPEESTQDTHSDFGWHWSPIRT